MSGMVCKTWEYGKQLEEGSSHYGIGKDGEIGQYVNEADTAWTNSNQLSNRTSITIRNI